MALTRLKVAMGLALAVGIAATVGWVGVHRETRVLAAPGQEMLPARRDKCCRQASPSGRPRRTEPKASAEGRGASFGNPAASALAGQAIQSPTPGDPIKVARPMPDGLVGSSRQTTRRSSRIRMRRDRSRQTGVAAKPGRAIRADEQARGEVLFAKEWVPNDPMSHGGDGLGPVYNETSCVACQAWAHPAAPGRRARTSSSSRRPRTAADRPSPWNRFIPASAARAAPSSIAMGPIPEYGSWRRRFFDPNRERAAERAREPRRAMPSPDRIRGSRSRPRPNAGCATDRSGCRRMDGFSIRRRRTEYASLVRRGSRSTRSRPRCWSRWPRSQPDKVRGRVSRTREGRIGRFGWKAQIPSLHEFVRVACANELGLEVPGHSQATSPLAPSKKAKGLDLTESECDALVAYIRALPAPVAVDPFGPQGTNDMREGRRLFADVGCTTCHTPTLGPSGGSTATCCCTTWARA